MNKIKILLLLCVALLPSNLLYAGLPSHRALVKELLQTDGYTYVRYVENNIESWFATISTKEINVGDTVEFPDSPPMIDFEAHKLKMTFPKIIFASGWKKVAAKENQQDATISKNQIVRYIKDEIQNTSYMKSQNPYSQGSSQYEIYNNYIYNLLNNDLFLNKLVGTVYSYKDSNIDIKKLTKAWIFEKLSSGITKLSYSDLKEYFIIYEQMLDNSQTIDECAMLSAGDAHAKVYPVLGRMGDAALTKWLRLTSKAVLVGMDEQIEAPSISKDQEEIAWQILYSGASEEQLKEIIRISDNLETATSAEKCWSGVFVINRLNSMKDEPQKWAAYAMIKYMFK